METLTTIIGVLVGIAVGLAIGWLMASARAQKNVQEVREQIQAEREQRLTAETRLQEMAKQLEAQKGLLDEARTQLSDTFKALSSDALQANSQAFVERAKETLEPLQQALRRYEDHLRELEQTRQRAYGKLDEQLRQLAEAEHQLQRETGNLVSALRRPQVRGRWGELTLRRVVEIAGMADHVDYAEQVSADTDQGRLRPDMIVHLPAGRQVVVDAKVSLDAYLSSIEAPDEESRKSFLAKHAQQLREHIRMLSAKSYWQQFQPTPEFVVLFVPGESFLHAACDVDHTLIEDGMKEGVVLASPTTLVALLRAVAYGWRQEQMAKSAQQVSDLGKQLYERLGVFIGHLSNVGRRLRSTTEAFNQAVGSLEARVLPSARRFRDLGAAGGEELGQLEPVDVQPRGLPEPGAPEDEQSASQ